MALPIVQDANQNLMLMQRNWKSKLDPLFSGQFIHGNALTNVNLTVGTNSISHGLGYVQSGWVMTDINAPSTVYRMSAFNNKTLILSSNAQVTISLWVF